MILFLLALAGAGWGGFLFIKFSKKKQHQRLHQAFLETHFVLKNLPLHWVFWKEGDGLIGCSLSCLDLLGLDQQIPPQDFLEYLEERGNIPIQRAFHHIYETGGVFQFDALLQEGPYHINGRVFIDPKTRTRSFLISLQDTSPWIRNYKQTQDSEQTLRQEIESLHHILDVSPFVLWRRNAQGQIDFCNQVYARALDTHVYTVLAEGIELFPKSSPHSQSLAQKALKTWTRQSQRTHLVLGGERRWLEIVEIPLPGPPPSTVGYAIDITEMEEVEHHLRQHLDACYDLLNHISSSVVMYGSDTRLFFFNDAYLKEFGHEETFLHGQPTILENLDYLRQHRRIPEFSDFPAYKKTQLSFFNTVFTPVHEWSHLPDGRVLRTITIPHPSGGVVYIFENVTEKLALERGYNTLVAVQKETLDHLGEGIIVWGTDSRIRLCNTLLIKLWALEDLGPSANLQDFMATIRSQFASEESAQHWYQTLLNLMSRRVYEKGELALKNDRIFSYNYVPLPDGSHLISFSDISDRWMFEKALQERNQILEQADNLKRHFVSHVSYELKSPLNTIAGFTDILSQQYFGPLNPRQMDYCQEIARSVERLMGLINDMLDFAQVESGRVHLTLERIHLGSFLETVADLVRNRAQDQGLTFLVNNTCTHAFVCIDPRRLKQALFNLMNNALKFTPSGGTISLSAQMASGDSQYFQISVKDTGQGIPQEEQDKIFGVFEVGQTSGIGLSLVQRLILLHEGTLRLISQEGEGTEFICTLPIKTSEDISCTAQLPSNP